MDSQKTQLPLPVVNTTGMYKEKNLCRPMCDTSEIKTGLAFSDFDIKLEPIPATVESDPIPIQDEATKLEPMTKMYIKCEPFQEVFIKMEPMEVELPAPVLDVIDPLKEEIHSKLDIQKEGVIDMPDSLSIKTDTGTAAKVTTNVGLGLIISHEGEIILNGNECSTKIKQNISTKKRQEKKKSLIRTSISKLADRIPLPIIQCALCKTVFKDTRYLTEHTKRKHTDYRRTIYCTEPDCGKAFFTKYSLNHHSAVHTNIRKYKCNKCEVLFKHPGDCKRHELRHDDLTRYKCSKCEMSFKNPGDCKRHEYRHDNLVQFECDVCKKKLSSKSALRSHILNYNHMDEKSKVFLPLTVHICKICKKSFPTENALLAHSSIHADFKYHLCNVCQTRHVSRNSLKQHQSNIHNIKPYPCSLCSAWFFHKQNLGRHTAEKHKGTSVKMNLVPCPYCPISLKTPGGLTIHIKVKHPEHKSILYIYNCSECTSIFKDPYQLKKHVISLHTKDKGLEYECEICEKTFSSVSNLEDHLKLHASGVF